MELCLFDSPDAIESQSPEARFAGGTQYPLQGRTLVLFTLDGNGRHRRASDQTDVADEIVLKVSR